jgi:hypothetical protein
MISSFNPHHSNFNGRNSLAINPKINYNPTKTEIHTNINLESESKQIPNHTHDFRVK